MDGLLKLLPAPQPAWVRYGLTAVLVAVMFALRISMQNGTGLYGFILYVPAVVGAALLFDRSSGFFALAVSCALVASLLDWTPQQTAIHVSALTSFILIGAGLVGISSGLRSALEKAEAAKLANDLLIEEMSHRVKNKFAMILAIISLQTRGQSSEVKTALDAVAARVRVIAQVHNSLQQSRHGPGMNMRPYLTQLCSALSDVQGSLRPISIEVDAEPIDLPPDRALTVGLVVNELVNNAYKYAFPEERAGKIKVSLSAGSADEVVLAVADNGIGTGATTKPGLGTQLIDNLAARIGGAASRTQGNPGLAVVVTFNRGVT